MDNAQIDVRVQPRSSRNEIIVEGAGRLRVYVTAPPEGGKANDALISLLSKRLRVAKGSIRVLRGHKARNKVLVVEGLGVEEITTRMEATARSGGREAR